jgi:hypothetical protein
MSAASLPPESRSERIDVRDGASLDRWAERLGVSREALVRVVEIAGDRAGEVADYLRSQGLPASDTD